VGIDLTHLDKTPISAARNFSTVIVPWIWHDELLFKRMTMGLDHGSFISVCANPAMHGWKRRLWYAHGFRLSTTVGWLFVKEAKPCCDISRTWKHIFHSGSVTRQDFRRPVPNGLGVDAGFPCRLTTNPTEFSLPITDMKTAVCVRRLARTKNSQKQKLDKKTPNPWVFLWRCLELQ